MTENTSQEKSALRGFFLIIKKIIHCIYYTLEKIFFLAFLLILVVGLAWWLSQKPSLYRDWEPQDAILPEISWSEDGNVTINNIRNHEWTSDVDFIPQYISETYNPEEITGIDYIITPFANFIGPAHIMLSFSFQDGRKLAISSEIRKEYGETFDAFRGIMNQYEIQYVIATEEDVIKLRTNYRKNNVIMYPISTPQEKMQHMFRSMLVRADKLTKEPEFYNTLWNNCSTSVLSHANAFRQEKIGLNKYIILPEESDEILFNLWLVDTPMSIEEARKFYNISEKARNIPEWENFSDWIRK